MPDRTARGRVLVVDDDVQMCTFMDEALRGLGFDVQCASDGALALEKVRALRPDVIISDLVMPGMDGLALLEAIMREAPSIKFVLISGQASVKAAVQAIDLGAVDFIVKPVDPDRLAALMCNTVEERRRTPRQVARAFADRRVRYDGREQQC